MFTVAREDVLFVNLIEKGKHRQMQKNPNFECENKSMDMNLCVCMSVSNMAT